MIELERHIEILLLGNDCVIVPDLGGFMTHHVNARYDEADSLFLPPLRTLGFNPQLTMNDSLLVQSYIEAYDISYPEALRRIEGEVAELRQHLDTEGFYELNDIGTLRLNEEGHLEFEPCEAGILTPSLYGLSSFEMLPVDTKSSTQTEQKPQPTVAEEVVTVVTEEGNEVIADDEKPVEEQAKAKEEDSAIIIKMSWIRNAAAIAAAIVAFFVIQTPVSNSHVIGEVQQSSILPITKQQPSTKASTPKDETPVAEAPKTTAKPAPTPQAESKKETGYCIVLASQTARRHAEDFVDRLAKQGHGQARIMDMQNTSKVRVVYGLYPTEGAAYKQLLIIRKLKECKEAWVLELK